MKKSLVARGFIGAVASLLGVAAVGCSAESGDYAETEVGSTSEALSVLAAPSNPVDLSSNVNDDQRAQFSSSCAFKFTPSGGSVRSFFVKAGGFNAAGTTATSKIWMLERGGAAWVTQAATLTTARGQAQSYQLDDTHCAVIAGSDQLDATGTPLATVDLLTLNTSGATPVVNVTTLGSLATARSDFKVTTCADSNGDKHIVVVAGRDASAGTQEIATIEVSRKLSDVIANAASLWRTTTTSLPQGVYDFGLDKTTGNEYMVAAGDTGSGAVSKIQLFTLTTITQNSIVYCDLPDANHVKDATTNVGSSLKGNEVHYDAVNSKFLVGFGIDTGAAALFGGKLFTTNFGAVPYTATFSANANPPAGAYRPVKVRTDANTAMFMGGSNAAITASLASVQEYGSGAYAGAVNLNQASYGASAALLDAPNPDEVFIANGASTPGTLGINVDALNP